MPAFDIHKYRKSRKERSAGEAESKQSEAAETVATNAQSDATIVPIPLRRCSEKTDLASFRVGGVPSIYYVPEFLSAEAEDAIQHNVRQHPWVQLKTRRLQFYGGVPSATIQLEPLPAWLEPLCGFLVDAGVFPERLRPNHVLVNEYLPGDGIMAHSDGPLYHGLVAILSACETATMVFKRRLATDEIGAAPAEGPGGDSSNQFSLVLQPRSLLVFAEEAYTAWLHEIPARDVDVVGENGECVNAHLASVEPGQLLERQVARISLTIRHVPPQHESAPQGSPDQA